MVVSGIFAVGETQVECRLYRLLAFDLGKVTFNLSEAQFPNI